VQRDACVAYCRQHGIIIEAVFVDTGVSAKPRVQPALKELYQYCRAVKGRINTVIVYSPDRMSPVSLDRVNIVRAFEPLGIHVEPTDGGFSLDTVSGLTDSIVYAASGSRRFRIARERRMAKEMKVGV